MRRSCGRRSSSRRGRRSTRRARVRFGALADCRAACCCRSISARWSPGSMPGSIFNTWPLIDGALRARRRAAVVRAAAVAQFVREHAHRPVRSPHAGLCDLASRRFCTPSMRCAARRDRARRACRSAARGDAAGRLGIVTLLHQAPLALALAHQALAIVVLTVAVDPCRAAAPSR